MGSGREAVRKRKIRTKIERRRVFTVSFSFVVGRCRPHGKQHARNNKSVSAARANACVSHKGRREFLKPTDHCGCSPLKKSKKNQKIAFSIGSIRRATTYRSVRDARPRLYAQMLRLSPKNYVSFFPTR